MTINCGKALTIAAEQIVIPRYPCSESQLDVAGLDFSEFNRTMIRLGVVLHQAGIDAYDTDEKLPELDRVHLPTVYNGICEAFNLKTTVETNFKLRFR